MKYFIQIQCKDKSLFYVEYANSTDQHVDFTKAIKALQDQHALFIELKDCAIACGSIAMLSKVQREQA